MRLQGDVVRMCAVGTVAALSVQLAPRSAQAQNLPLAQVLPDLVLGEIVLQSPAAGLSHVAHFSPIEAKELTNPVVGIVQSFNSQMATQFATFPLGSSTGGFTYVFDESVGTLRRGSASFGPSFAERALTIGRRKVSVGFNYQHTSYNTFEGQNLDDGSIKFYLRHQDCCTILNPGPNFIFLLQPNGTLLSPPFEGDLIEAALSLEAKTNTTAVFANYGLTSHWDVGLAVPFVTVALDARVRARILRLVTGPPPTANISAADRQAALNVHTFEVNNPDATLTVQHAGRAAGLGDVVLRTKYQFLRAAAGGLAAAVDLRLPTGDKDNLLGAGGTEAKFLLVASTERGVIGGHVNFGYTAARGAVPGTVAGLTAAPIPDEINYTSGVELVASPRLTINGDVVGRTLRGAGRLDLASKKFAYVAFNDNGPIFQNPGCENSGFGCTSIALDEFAPRPGNLTLMLGTAGAKFNLRGNLLLSGSVLFPLSNAGLRSRVTTVIGVDYAF